MNKDIKKFGIVATYSTSENTEPLSVVINVDNADLNYLWEVATAHETTLKNGRLIKIELIPAITGDL